MDSALEIVLYQLKPGFEREKFLELSQRATDWLKARPGYLGRELYEDESGLLIDLVRWASVEDALAAAAAFGETEGASTFMDAVDSESVRMMHPRRVATYD